jgi:hypothetical protein
MILALGMISLASDSFSATVAIILLALGLVWSPVIVQLKENKAEIVTCRELNVFYIFLFQFSLL